MSDDSQSERAWSLGQAHAREVRFDAYSRDKNSERLYAAAMRAGCPFSYFDVFKYGAQAVWRERGEL